MRYFYQIILILLFLSSCRQVIKQEKKNEKLVQSPSLESPKNYESNSFNEDFFNYDHYSYSVNRLGDSTKYFHTTETIVVEDNSKNILKLCDVSNQGDSLILKLTAMPNFNFIEPYELTLLKQGKKYTSKLSLTYAIGDTNWRRPVFTTINQMIFLDKENYKKGDSLRGKVSLLISAHHTAFEIDYTDTIKIYGLIKTIVK